MHDSKKNAVDYLEIPSGDLARTKAFFTALFGWEFTDYGPDYTCFHDGRLGGGFFASPQPARCADGSVLVVFFHPALEQVRDQAKALGAVISRDIFSFPGGRRFHFIEPGGSELAIWSDQ